jgi:hypothetical protein
MPSRPQNAKWIGIENARASAFASGHKVLRNCEFTGFLPLELSPGLNAFAEMAPWKREKVKRAALALLIGQYGGKRKTPLTGRPTVRLTRFSSVEPDAHSAWSKVPVDCLVASWRRGGKRHDGMGFLEDDRPSKIELITLWKSAKRGQGFVMVEVLEDVGT